MINSSPIFWAQRQKTFCNIFFVKDFLMKCLGRQFFPNWSVTLRDFTSLPLVLGGEMDIQYFLKGMPTSFLLIEIAWVHARDAINIAFKRSHRCPKGPQKCHYGIITMLTT